MSRIKGQGIAQRKQQPPQIPMQKKVAPLVNDWQVYEDARKYAKEAHRLLTAKKERTDKDCMLANLLWWWCEQIEKLQQGEEA